MKRALIIFAIGLVAMLGWVSYDLFAPQKVDLRTFDSDAVAKIEASMWRSYYERRPVRLFNELSELLRTQYEMPIFRSNRVAYYAARAAFTFKTGKRQPDYDKALPYLVEFYEAVGEIGDLPINAERAASLELEWWIIHRERRKHKPGDLGRALAELQAEIYSVPLETLLEHGNLRAEAMTLRDTIALEGPLADNDWVRIEEILHRAWHSLFVAVNP